MIKKSHGPRRQHFWLPLGALQFPKNMGPDQELFPSGDGDTRQEDECGTI